MSDGNNYTEKTRAWLESRFRVEDGEIYRAHEPIYGLDQHTEYSEPDHLWRAAKTVQIMRVLAGVQFNTLLDIGAAEGYTSNLAKTIFNADVTVTDVSLEAMLRARDLFGLPGASINASNLPFKDNAFDVVLCAECIEHLEHPFEFIMDAARVARKCLIISTMEGKSCYPAAWLQIYRLPADEPHGHRSSWCPRDFKEVFGERAVSTAQNLQRPWTRAEPFALLKNVTVPPPPHHLGEGIITHVFFDESARRAEPAIADDELIRRIVEFKVDLRPASVPPDREPPPNRLLDVLQCPACRRGDLAYDGETLCCGACAARYPVKGGVPDLFTAQPADLDVLAEQTKLGPPDRIPARLAWARKRSKRFDRAPRLHSDRLKYFVGRLMRFTEFYCAQPGAAGKLRFLLGKVFPALKKSAARNNPAA